MMMMIHNNDGDNKIAEVSAIREGGVCVCGCVGGGGGAYFLAWLYSDVPPNNPKTGFMVLSRWTSRKRGVIN